MTFTLWNTWDHFLLFLFAFLAIKVCYLLIKSYTGSHYIKHIKVKYNFFKKKSEGGIFQSFMPLVHIHTSELTPEATT